MRTKSYELYLVLTRRYNNTREEKRFSIIDSLLEGKKFSENEKTLIQEIIEIGQLCEKLIHDKAGLISNSALTFEYFPKLTVHYRILRLVFDDKLKDDVELFGDYHFPSEVDRIVKTEIERLKKELGIV